ncbi:LysE family translocator [Phaeovulum vinaykumarii]|uniref:Threonine/homoserine/homoserine lactone efflux protein n=1 Tax=Phaeovulum vinaykumarii TaxID=407234 RepID=A0A1N7KZM7_9RHOB|nr:LysE family translocator [Phaeovulum vinaykumarii]SIS67034.1 Threonine/homoserine/homoserine lactone efflux protein [Phaeovulum vinaykumarii]SOC00871.1 threonine/homoserine/homoserine lactone efflux protein [Phaeovulum vinaykumarii]
MFDYGLAHWLTFGTAAVLLNLAPGPDLAFILGKTAQGGRRLGVAAMLGVWSGALVHVGLAALGLSAVLASSATAFALVKWLGAAYLVWLGIQAFRAGGAAPTAAIAPARGSAWRTWRTGVLINLTNPKMAIFMLAFLPQFVVPGAGPVAAQLALHGALVIVAAGLVEPWAIILGDVARRRMSASARMRGLIDRALGVTFIGLGVKLAAASRP